ncbi:MAG TPA: hypothetical protein VKR32_08265 [Puia sp.]|nr:hypothetical protein [Puia sp.]
MQYLNDDNMDELFRRAAEDYPLKTGAENWNEVNAALRSGNADSNTEAQAEGKKSFRKYLWLLLLLPMVWICNSQLFRNDSTQTDDKLTIARPVKPVDGNANNSKENKSNLPANPSVKNQKPANSLTQAEGSAVAESLTHKQETKTLAASVKAPNKNGRDEELKDAASFRAGGDSKSALVNKKTGPHALVNTTGNNKLTADGVSKLQRTANGLPKATHPDQVAGQVTKNEAPPAGKDGVSLSDQSSETPAKTVDKAPGNNLTSSMSPATKPASPKTDSARQVASVPAAKKTIDSKSTSHHFLYAGILAGGDVSTVRFQEIQHTGYSAGVLVGYQLNNRLSVESGLLFDKKFYYTDGKYFSTKKIDIPAGVTINSATGDCYMFEWPINVKYNWTSTAKSNWFSTLGTSSYFMKKENYDYSYTSAGWPIWGMKSYTNSSTTWFGVINLSGGYMHTLGKAGSLRVEPYLKIPVQGMGIGSLSIWSTGIYVSFVKKIF